MGLFLIVLEENSQKILLTVLESENLPKLQDLDTESQIFNLSGLCKMEDENFFLVSVQIFF